MAADPDTTRTYSPQRGITEEEIFAIEAALQKTGGHKSLAAQMLGMEPQRLYNVVKNTPALSARWVTRKENAPPEDSLSNRVSPDKESALPPIDVTDHKAVEAVRKQDALLTKGWDKLGFTPQDKEFLLSLQLQYATNTRNTADLVYAGAAHTNARLILEFEKVLNLIRDVDEHKDTDKYRRYAFSKEGAQYEVKGPHEFRLELYNTLIRISDTLRKTSGDLVEANRMKLAIAKLEKEMRTNEGPKTVEGWNTPPKVTK